MLKEILEEELGDIQVSLKYKTIFRGKQNLGGARNSTLIKGIHIKLNKVNFSKDFYRAIERYRRSKSGFKDKRKIRF